MKKLGLSKGWLPNYHGAWAMIIIPVILGIIYSGFVWQHAVFLMLWFLGYFAFFATSQWLHFNMRDDYFLAVKVYGLALLPLAVAMLILAPYLIWWSILYMPLLLIAFIAAKNRNERALLNDIATVLAGGLALAISYDLGVNAKSVFANSLFGVSGIWGSGYLSSNSQIYVQLAWQKVWLISALLILYFVGTIFYVKTNIRERKSNLYLFASISFHIVITILVWFLVRQNILNFSLAILWACLTIRAVAVPVYGRKRHWLSPKKIGIMEIMFSIWTFLALL